MILRGAAPFVWEEVSIAGNVRSTMANGQRVCHPVRDGDSSTSAVAKVTWPRVVP